MFRLGGMAVQCGSKLKAANQFGIGSMYGVWGMTAPPKMSAGS
jgi:hypothetical protein